jgi:hypothetical protein
VLPAAAAASATASPGVDGGLIELGRQRLALKQKLEGLAGCSMDAEINAVCDHLWAVEDKIVSTEARSWAGLLVKLDAAQAEIEKQLSDSGASEPAFADLCGTIRSLARINLAHS